MDSYGEDDDVVGRETVQYTLAGHHGHCYGECRGPAIVYYPLDEELKIHL